MPCAFHQDARTVQGKIRIFSMIAFLQGRVADKNQDSIVLDVGGVGFLVYTNTATIAKAGQEPDKFKVYTHMIVREDAMDICGFATKEELEIFKKLIAISSVGAKSAISILSQMTVSQLAAAVVTQDAKAIAKAQGIGIKTAQKIILDLQGKIKDEDIVRGFETGGSDAQAVSSAPDSSYAKDAYEALCALGFPSQDVLKVVTALQKDYNSADEIIRQALRRLSPV